MADDFDEIRFPDKIDYGSVGGPSYKTTIITTDSGKEQRIQHWTRGRGKWSIASGIKSRTQRDELIAFFRARKGRARGFRFKDWDDYKAASQDTLEIDSTHYQLIKEYTSGDQVETRVIYKPVAATLVLTRTGGGSLPSHTLDDTTGIIAFSSAPAAFTATFEFDVPVRFDTDDFRNSREGYEVNTWSDITLLELFL